MIKGKINNEAFTTMIDSGSSITNLIRLLKQVVILARPLPKTEQYVDYNNKPLNRLGFTTVDVQVGKRKLGKARKIITRDGKRSLIGQDWLTQLNFTVGEANGNSEYTNIIKNISLRKDIETLKQKFPKICSRKRKKGIKVNLSSRRMPK